MHITMQKRLLNYWLRLKCDSRRKLAPVMYNLLRKMSDVNSCKSQWIDDVKSVLNCTGFSNCWDASDINNKWFVKAIDRRLKDIELQDWNAEVSSNRLCTFYRMIKQHHQEEPYLVSLQYSLRINLAKFRCGNNNLPINSGRWNCADGPTLCPLCEKGCPGDEFHYTLECKFFHDIRTKFIPAHYWTRPNALKLYRLFNTTNGRTLGRLAKYVKLIMNHFRNTS